MAQVKIQFQCRIDIDEARAISFPRARDTDRQTGFWNPQVEMEFTEALTLIKNLMYLQLITSTCIGIVSVITCIYF